MRPDDALFDARVNAHEAGHGKPEARLFELAERTLDIEPRRVPADRRSAVNCAAARRLGWHAVHHVRTDETVAQLRLSCPRTGAAIGAVLRAA